MNYLLIKLNKHEIPIFLFIGCYIKLFSQNQTVDLNYFFSHQETIFDDSIPTPESIVGHQIGEWHITHDKLLQYMEVLAKSSDRIKIENRGFTYEDRPLILLTITSPENHQNIDQIKKEHKEISNGKKFDSYNNIPFDNISGLFNSWK